MARCYSLGAQLKTNLIEAIRFQQLMELQVTPNRVISSYAELFQTAQIKINREPIRL